MAEFIVFTLKNFFATNNLFDFAAFERVELSSALTRPSSTPSVLISLLAD